MPAAKKNATVIVENGEPAPQKKKAAKKPVKVVAVVTADGIDGSFTQEPRRPLIAHLNIRTNEVMFNDQLLRYDPNPPPDVDPKPYDAADDNLFAATQEHLEVKAPVQEVVAPAAAPVEVSKAMPCFTKANLMVQFKECSEKKLLPESTTIACFWCAHHFEGRPCVIPEREVNMVYTVYGNFCTPSCGISYLLTENLDPHVRWERMALIHRIYDSNGTGRIFPAPARESLNLFGGPLSIESFRAIVLEKKVRVDLHMPPMVSILGSIDTKPIDFFDTNLKQGGAVMALPQRSVEEGLRLKRNKPLKERESTLDTVMNIKVTGKRNAL